MIKLRKSNDRGPSNLGWLNSKHTFSFAHYYDEAFMGYESLRVINDDHVVAGAGFGTHPHKDMEIISYVLDGALEHKDSMGNGSVIKKGEVQFMSAGTGVTHSEYNHSKTDEVHFLQIWFLPDEEGLTPKYEQKFFADEEKRGKFRLVVSKEGREGSLSINQDVDMSVALMDGDEEASYDLTEGRKVWLHIARGEIVVNGEKLEAGDGAAIEDISELKFSDGNKSEIIIFDMAPYSSNI